MIAMLRFRTVTLTGLVDGGGIGDDEGMDNDKPHAGEVEDAARHRQPQPGRIVMYTVDNSNDGVRLDRFLASQAEDLSRSRLQALIAEGYVSDAGVRVTEASAKVKPGTVYTVQIPNAVPSHMAGEAQPLNVVFEDAAILVLDKPAGLVVHPGAGNPDGTLVNALIAHCGSSLSGIGGVARPGIVHRLDKDTSGLMVVAKTDEAHRHLAAQFADHGREGVLRREYVCFVWGKPNPVNGRISTYITRHPGLRQKMVVSKTQGREAITHYRTEAAYASRDDDRSKAARLERAVVSRVRCRLETGRTHQVRVHIAYMGAPIVGDAVYGAGFHTKLNRLPEPTAGVAALVTRQALHAALLRFEHPVSHKVLTFESALPADMAALQLSIDTHLEKVSKD
jgi:23S rRNA pseudouridine1911/1915/1917 synthase